MTVPGSPADASGIPAGADLVLADFTDDGAEFSWYVVNDNVMGGRSEGTFTIEQGTLRFAGRTNTDGGGYRRALAWRGGQLLG
jgi:hypothetical protein